MGKKIFKYYLWFVFAFFIVRFSYLAYKTAMEVNDTLVTVNNAPTLAIETWSRLVGTAVTTKEGKILASESLLNGIDVIGIQIVSDVDTTDKAIALINRSIEHTNILASKGTRGELILTGPLLSLTGFDASNTGKGINAGIKDIKKHSK